MQRLRVTVDGTQVEKDDGVQDKMKELEKELDDAKEGLMKNEYTTSDADVGESVTKRDEMTSLFANVWRTLMNISTTSWRTIRL